MLNTQQKIKFSEHAVLYDILIPYLQLIVYQFVLIKTVEK